MNQLAPDLTPDLSTRDALRLLNVMTTRLHAAIDAVEGDLDDEGDGPDDA